MMVRSRIYKMTNVFFIALILSPPAQAATITLSTGKIIRGEILEKTKETVRVKFQDQFWSIPQKFIVSIEGEEAKDSAGNPVSGAATTNVQTPSAKVRVAKTKDGWQLLVDDKPYFVKGVCYTADRIGESPHENTLRDWMIVDSDHDGWIDAPYQSWVDRNGNNRRDDDEKDVGDFQLLHDMGCNTIRVYHHASADPQIQELNPGKILFNHAPNKKVLRELYEKFGIRVMIGDLIGAYVVGSGASWERGTDYRRAVQRNNMLKSVDAMVKEFKDEPYVLMWALGNENNYNDLTRTNAKADPRAYAKFVNEAAKRIHELDPNHPVCLVNGETHMLDAYAEFAPEIDIFGINSYRNSPGFNTLWKEVALKLDKPVLLTEYGTAHPPVFNRAMKEKIQAKVHKGAWLDILDHAAGKKEPQNAIGGFAFTWMDNWWEDGNPRTHDIMEDGWHHEWNGIASQGDGRQSPLMRQLREVYFMYQELWKE